MLSGIRASVLKEFRSRSDFLRNWQAVLAWGGLLLLLLFQVYAYGYRLDLSLGPRVILQPWLLRSGFIQYETAIDMHTPLMPLILALVQPLAPNGLFLAKFTLLALLSLILLLVFWIASRRSGWLAGLGAAAFFVLWSVIFGFPKLWHETFLAPLYLGVWLLYKPQAEASLTRRVLAGFLCGLMVLTKQHGAVVAVAFLAWAIFTGFYFRNSYRKIINDQIAFCLAAAAPVVAYIVWQAMTAGTLSGLWFWTVVYPFSGSYSEDTYLAITTSQALVLVIAGLFLPIAMVAMVELRHLRDSVWLWLGCGFVLLFSSVLTAFPRFSFFHLQPALPLVAILTAVTLAYYSQAPGPHRSFVRTTIGVALLMWLLCNVPNFKSLYQPTQPRKIWEYSDLVALANTVRQSVEPGKCFFILGDDEALSNLYYLTGCLPPRYWIFNYPWYMTPSVSQSILATLQSSMPDYVLYFPGRNNVENTAPELVAFIQSHYSDSGELDWSSSKVHLLKYQY